MCSSSSPRARCGPAASSTTPSRWRCTSTGRVARCRRSRSSPTWSSACAANGAARATGAITPPPRPWRSSSTSTRWDSSRRSGRRSAVTCSRACVTSFACRCWPRVRRTAPEHWSIEHWSKVFNFEGTPVWIAPDFGFWTVEGRLALVDWKTGAADIEATSFQLGCYALYAREMLGVEPARVDLLQVNLREPEVTPLTWDDGRLEEIRQQLRLSIRSMRAYLADADGQCRAAGRFREDRGAEDLSLVQLQEGLPAGAAAGGGCRLERLARAASLTTWGDGRTWGVGYGEGAGDHEAGGRFGPAVAGLHLGRGARSWVAGTSPQPPLHTRLPTSATRELRSEDGSSARCCRGALCARSSYCGCRLLPTNHLLLHPTPSPTNPSPANHLLPTSRLRSAK